MLATVLVVVALPVFLIAQSVRSVALDADFYTREFSKYQVGQVTGLSSSELARVAQGFAAYFEAAPAPIDLRVNLIGQDQPLFNEREVQHMQDVQALMGRIFQARFLALVGLAIGIMGIVLTGTSSAGPAVARAGLLGGGLAVLLVGLLALGSMFDFEALFLQFHYLSFSNTLWLLDPARDRLIQLFPEGFFYEGALRIGLQAVGEGAIIALGSAAALRFLG